MRRRRYSFQMVCVELSVIFTYTMFFFMAEIQSSNLLLLLILNKSFVEVEDKFKHLWN